MVQTNVLINIYLTKKLAIDKKIELIGDYLFHYSKKGLTKEFKCSFAVEFVITLNNGLLLPKFDPKDSKHYNPDFIVNIRPTDYKIINEITEKLNEQVKTYEDETETYIYSDYHNVFVEYAKYNHPSNNNRGSFSHSQIDNMRRIQNEIKANNKELFERIQKKCTQNGVGISLVVLTAARLFRMVRIDDENYQINLKNEDMLLVLEEYYEQTNTKRFKDEYAKISLIRSCINDLAYFCFHKKFAMYKEGYYRMKFHSRMVIKIKETKLGVRLSNTINNHSLHSFNNLLHKLFHFTKFTKYNIKYYKRRNKSSINNSS